MVDRPKGMQIRNPNDFSRMEASRLQWMNQRTWSLDLDCRVTHVDETGERD